MTISPRSSASAALETYRHGMHPPLWRALRDLVESDIELSEDQADLFCEIAEKAEDSASWTDEQILDVEVALAQWLTKGALEVLGLERTVTPVDPESARSAAHAVLNQSVNRRADHRALRKGLGSPVFYGSGLKGAMEMIDQFPGRRPSGRMHIEIVRISRMFPADLYSGDPSAIPRLRDGFLAAIRSAL